jgi:hypothetical protein
MTRNQKIALGCGGAGCLGLLVVGIAGVLIFYFGWRNAGSFDDYANYNSNSNDNFNLNSNDNANDDSTDSSSSNSSSSSSDSEYSEDEKHKLFQAAAITGDLELQRRVWVKIGIVEEDYTPGPKYAEFIDAHSNWGVDNFQWVASMNTPEKGRAYVNENLR